MSIGVILLRLSAINYDTSRAMKLSHGIRASDTVHPQSLNLSTPVYPIPAQLPIAKMLILVGSRRINEMDDSFVYLGCDVSGAEVTWGEDVNI